MELIELELKDGKKIFIEPVDSKGITEAGARDKIKDKVDDILSIIPSIASSFIDAVDKMGKKPSSLSTEFGISIAAEGGIIIAKVSGEANFKVSLAWEFKK